MQQKSSKPQKGFSEKQGMHRRNAALTHTPILINKEEIMATTKENAMKAFKKALAHKKEAKNQFERWLRERGVEGKVVTL